MKPNFLVIGAEKSGTTWLYNKLREHPEIYLPLTKECHFFNRYNSNLEENLNYKQLGWEWYHRFFDDIPESAKAYGEVTPMYLCDPKAPERIAKDLPDVKLIYILRNPITRAYSHYWMAYRKGHTDKSFEEIVAEKDARFIKRGNYAQQLQAYYNLFPEKNLKGFIYEDFFEDPQKHLLELYNFLKVIEIQEESQYENKKIHAAPKPKSKIVYHLIGKLTKALRKNAVTFNLLDKIKELGIASVIKSWNTNSEAYPKMEKNIHNELLNYYMSDIKKLENDFNLNVDVWRNDSPVKSKNL